MQLSAPGHSKTGLFSQRLDAFSGKTLEQMVQELADREEIRDLVAAYAHRMARGVSVADLFTDDAVYINRGTIDLPPREVRGRAALEEYYGASGAWAEPPLSMIHNQLISIQGDEASGICSVEVRAASGGVSIVASGYVQDRYRRETGRWKISEREASFFHWTPLHQGWAAKQQRT